MPIFVKKEVEMKRFLPMLILFVAVVLLSSSYCDGPCTCVCKCKCHDGVEECQEYCWRCAHKHHEDCKCECHDDASMEDRYGSHNDFCRRRNCDNCLRNHWDLEMSTDYGMKKGWLPKKRPYLHPQKDYPSLMYAFDRDRCE